MVLEILRAATRDGTICTILLRAVSLFLLVIALQYWVRYHGRTLADRIARHGGWPAGDRAWTVGGVVLGHRIVVSLRGRRYHHAYRAQGSVWSGPGASLNPGRGSVVIFGLRPDRSNCG